MSHHDEDLDARLARLRSATAGVQPRPGFAGRVMGRIGQEQLGTLWALKTPARRFFPIGMLAAALALVWAVSVDDQVNEALAVNDDVELSW
jgi:hypothetical protein